MPWLSEVTLTLPLRIKYTEVIWLLRLPTDWNSTISTNFYRKVILSLPVGTAYKTIIRLMMCYSAHELEQRSKYCGYTEVTLHLPLGAAHEAIIRLMVRLPTIWNNKYPCYREVILTLLLGTACTEITRSMRGSAHELEHLWFSSEQGKPHRYLPSSRCQEQGKPHRYLPSSRCQEQSKPNRYLPSSRC